MEFERPAGVADPETPLGQLQRGRGAGWLAAVGDPGPGRENLLVCLRQDPRWDRQVESRGEYYASLALRVGLTPDEIAAQERTENEWLCSEVLAAMFDQGCEEAGRYLPDDEEPDSRPGGFATPSPSPSAPIEALLREVVGSIPRQVIHRLQHTSDTAEIQALRDTAQDPSHPGFPLATQILGVRSDATAVTTAAKLLASDSTGRPRGAALRYLNLLPSDVTLPLARDWLLLPDGRGQAATRLLAEHAEPQDVPRVRARLSTASSYHTICDLVEALARVPELGPYPELRTVFTDACYSYARRQAGLALDVTDPEFPSTFAIECRWDCEAELRELGGDGRMPV